ncbi:MAG: DUF6290 family protein [Butyrivibrio sp.]|nr:DUF6290 family protein [Butyrivibrio sp.]
MNNKLLLSIFQAIKDNISKLLSQPIKGKIEDRYDMLCYKKAIKQHNKDGRKTFSLDQVEKELGIN